MEQKEGWLGILCSPAACVLVSSVTPSRSLSFPIVGGNGSYHAAGEAGFCCVFFKLCLCSQLPLG